MKNKIIVITMTVFMLVMLIGCRLEQEEAFVELLSYKESYVGDGSRVASIIRQLPGKESFRGIMLKTSEEPYGITLKYDTRTDEWKDENVQNFMMYNSASLFALVHNVNDVTFVLESDVTETVHFVRAEIEVLIDNEWAYYYENIENWEEGLYKPLYLEESE